MRSIKDCKKEFVARMDSELKRFGFEKKATINDTLFRKKIASGYQCAIFHFLDLGHFGIELDFGIRNERVQAWKNPIRNFFLTWNNKTLIRDYDLGNSFEISWEHLAGCGKWNYYRVDTVDEVESAVGVMLSRIQSDSEKFFAKYDDLQAVSGMFDEEDPDLKLLFRTDFTPTLMSGIATMFETRGRDAAFRLAEKYPKELAAQSGENIKAVLYQDSSYLMGGNKLLQGPNAKTPQQILDDASKEFEDFIKGALKKK